MGVAWDKKAGVLSQHPGCAKGAGQRAGASVPGSGGLRGAIRRS